MFKLYIGNEPYLSLREALRFATEIKESKKLEYTSLDAEKTDAGSLIDLLSSKSLFNPERLILLKRLYKNKNKDKIIEFLFDYLNEDITDTLLIWEDQKVSSVTKYVKFFKTKNLLEEFNQLNKRTFSTWAQKEIQESKLKIDSTGIRLLSEYSNFNPERFINNLKKLQLLESENISKEVITELAADTLEEDIWHLLDEINAGNNSSMLTLEKILKQGVDANYIIAMIARNLRLLTMVKDLRYKGAINNEIASVLRIPPFTVPSLSKAADSYSDKKLLFIYEKLTSLDYEIKVGRIAPELGLTMLCTIL